MSGDARRLALGTAQLGQRYGIANRSGQPELEEARAIVQAARAAEVDTVDTAMVYGTSESVLGAIGVDGLRVVTKLPPVPAETADVAAWVRGKVGESLKRLGAVRLYGLLLHHPRDVAGRNGTELLGTLRTLQSEGVVAKLGVSIYDPGELEPLLQATQLDLVQAPYNVLDRRLSQSGWLERLRRQGVEVHARSAFLQGLLLLDETRLPEAFGRWAAVFARWRAWARARNLSPLQAALGFILRVSAIDRVVVGVETAAQLREIVDCAVALEDEVPAELACNDIELIDPTRWKRN